jgi:16S rRNA (cytidine1402-2'-O)-methyltransferase
MPGTLFVVATPIGNLEDVSARALRVLREVAVIAAEDTRRTAHLLARYGITTPTTSLHQHNETGKSTSLVDRLRRGESVALVSDAGTPAVADPGNILVRAAIDAGIRVEAIPGPSAVMAALAASGLPVETFTFLGFPPTKSNDRNNWFEELRTAGRTVVFFEAPHRIAETLERVEREVGDRPVAIGRELTKAHEELVRGPISLVRSRLGDPRGEFTVVLDVGRSTEQASPAAISDAEILSEFNELTASHQLNRRRAVSLLGKRYGRAPNEVYAAIERGKKSGK